ncbi:MAG: hypothetical protein RBU30_01710 [Polyangia bacterium]|jgi:4-diphosphocytidyl-2-C-methyl-D-erythritol kinase|nr:hypothetical protein [Polyangia bacterium]
MIADPEQLTVRTTEPAPAKLNLCLRVLGRNHLGLHELCSIAEPLALEDQVEVSLSPEGEKGVGGTPKVTCRCPDHPELEGESNLAARAAERLLAHLGAPRRCEVTLRKRIPVGAGLGGGSADAAATLRGLFRLLVPRPPLQALEQVATSLGADLRFCLQSQAAVMRGTGDRLEPIELPGHFLCLVFAGEPLPTSLVFERHDSMKTGNASLQAPGVLGPKEEGPPSHPALPILSLEKLGTLVGNDLLPSALDLQPRIGEALEAMGKMEPIAAGMTGSGSGVFGLFANQADASKAARALVDEGWQSISTEPRQAAALWPPA